MKSWAFFLIYVPQLNISNESLTQTHIITNQMKKGNGMKRKEGK